MVKTCLPMQEVWVQPLGLKIPWSRKWQPTLVFLLRNAMDREAWGLQSMGSQRVGHDSVTILQQQLAPNPGLEPEPGGPFSSHCSVVLSISLSHMCLINICQTCRQLFHSHSEFYKHPGDGHCRKG